MILSRCGVKIFFAEATSAKPNVPESETRGSGISRSLDKLGKTLTTEPEHWRTPLVHYLENPGR
jgi:hypothetical protein